MIKRNTPSIKRWAPNKPCSICGQPLLEKHLSKDEHKRAYELKWGLHYACHMKMIGVADRSSR